MRLSLFIAALLSLAEAQQAPRAFLERAYAGYRDPDYNPLRKPGRVFAPSLVAAIKEDARLSDDEVGYLDGDPLCWCQDPAGMRPSISDVRLNGGGTASARVRIGFGGNEQRDLRLKLVRTGSGWRIADITTEDEPSLLDSLLRSNRERGGR